MLQETHIEEGETEIATSPRQDAGEARLCN